MKIYVQILLAVLVLLCATQRSSSTLYPKSLLLPIKETPSPGGFWKTRSEWKAYWVKDWVVKKIYVPIWKKVWGPTQLKEWVPTGVAKPPPTWKQHTTIH